MALQKLAELVLEREFTMVLGLIGDVGGNTRNRFGRPFRADFVA
jgi:hypothetical protein